MTVGRDRLRPEVREFVDILAAVFPDVGVSVTDAVEARRIMDASLSPFGRHKVGGVADRTIPGPPGAPELRCASTAPFPKPDPGPGRRWSSSTAAAGCSAG